MKDQAWKLVFFLIPALSPALRAAENVSFFKDTYRTVSRMASSPARMDHGTALWTAGIAGAGLLVYSYDGGIRHAASRNRTASLDDVSEYAEKIGDGGYELAFLAVYGGAGYLMKNEKMGRTAVMSLESFSAANILGRILKEAVGRGRPYSGNGKGSFKPFSFGSGRASFPSGHTISAFSIASVFAAEQDNMFAKAGIYSLAAFAALQRVYKGQHWASDVFAGAVLGVAAGKTVMKLNGRDGGDAAYYFAPACPVRGACGMTAMLRF